MTELWPWLRLLASRRRRLVTGAALLVAATLAAVGLLALSGWLITAAGVAGLLLAAGGRPALDVFVPGAGIRAFAIARTLARYGERVFNHDTVLRLLADIRTRVFAGLTRLVPREQARLRSAEALNRLTADVDALDQLYLRTVLPPVAAALAIGALGCLYAAFAPALGLVVPGVLLAGTVIAAAASWPAGAGAGERVAVEHDRLRDRVLDLADGLAELRAFGVLDRQRAVIARTDADLVRNQARLARRAAAGEAVATAVVHGGAVAALAGLAGAVHAGGPDGAVAVMLVLAVLGLVGAVRGRSSSSGARVRPHGVSTSARYPRPRPRRRRLPRRATRRCGSTPSSWPTGRERRRC